MLPGRDAFRKLWARGLAPPVWREVLADCETPVSAFRKVDHGENAFLLESVEGGEVWGRFSILAADVRATLSFKGGRGLLSAGDASRELLAKEPLGALREALAPLRLHREGTTQELLAVAPPPPFRGGAVGWLDYDAVHHYAPVPRPASPAGTPEAVFLLPESWLVFDRLRSRIAIVADTAWARAGVRGTFDAKSADSAWDGAVTRIDELANRLSAAASFRERGPAKLEVRDFDVSDAEFAKRVDAAKELIRAGDVIQVVLSRRREGTFGGDPLDVYRALRLVNPSPYMFYLRAGSTALAGSSPEALVRVEGGKLTTRPIAGTRPRGRDAAADEKLSRELLGDVKERAEHLMLVDLGRNDLGRVAKTGSVRVPDFMRVERYSHVMHLVSDVTAELADDKDAFDAVASVFPAGTLSGAPKIRAMQIIAEIENRRRGPYGGLVGWFGADGRADTAIGIRMARFDGEAFTVQAGAGIVFDSDPMSEAAETAHKSAGVLRALELAAAGLGAGGEAPPE